MSVAVTQNFYGISCQDTTPSHSVKVLLRDICTYVGIGFLFNSTVPCPRLEQRGYTRRPLNFVAKIET